MRKPKDFKETFEMQQEKAPWGYRTIKVSVHFWTDNLEKLPKSKVDKKTAWASGTINLRANRARGIKSDVVIFNHKSELLEKMAELLDRNDIKLIRPMKNVEFEKLSD